MKARARLACFGAALLLAACPSIPENTFACQSDRDCPPSFSCRSTGRCFQAAESAADCTGVCGDADQNGRFDANDAGWLQRVESSPEWRPLCTTRDADLFADGALTARDFILLRWMLEHGAPGAASCGRCNRPCPGQPGAPCPRCAWACGDVDLDGKVDGNDAMTLLMLPPTGVDCGCQLWSADVTGDGQLTPDDAMRLQTHFNPGGPALSCSP